MLCKLLLTVQLQFPNCFKSIGKKKNLFKDPDSDCWYETTLLSVQGEDIFAWKSFL